MRRLLTLLTLVLAPLAAAQDLPGPGEGAYTWAPLGLEPVDVAELVFTESEDILVVDSDLNRFDPETGTWPETDLPNPVGSVSSMLALRGDTLIAGNTFSRSLDGGLTWEYPCRDADGNRTCERQSVDGSHAIYEIPRGPYAGRLLGGGALYSDDRGASWTTAVVHANETNWTFNMHDFAALPSGRVVGSGEWGAGVSNDGGETWAPTDLFGPYTILTQGIEAFATPGSVQAHEAGGPEPSCGLADPTLCEGAVMLGTHGAEHARAWWTNDGGRAWVEGSLLPQVYDGPGWPFVALLTELDQAGTAPDGTPGAGRGVAVLGRGFVFATTDGGVTWDVAARAPSIGEGSLAQIARSAEVGPDGRLYVAVPPNGTADEYIFVSEAPASAAFAYVTASATSGPVDASELGVRVVPNPSASGTVTVDLTTPESVDVRAYVLDALGRRVADVLVGDASGTRSVELDTSTWAAGVYRVVVEADGARRVETFSVTR